MRSKTSRKTQLSTAIGLFGGVGMLAVMVFIAPENISAFFNLSGLIVVIGGTFAATLICRPIDEVKRVFCSLPKLLVEEKPRTADDIEQLIRVAQCLRHGDIHVAEEEVSQIDSTILKAGAQMVLDRADESDIVKMLQWHIAGVQTRDHADVHILRTMAGFAPAFGMLGTLFGLIHMLNGIGDSDLAGIGSTMGFAIISTLYGIVAANLFLKPLAIKLERCSQQRLMNLLILQEGIVLLMKNQHPVLIRETLEAFAAHQSPNGTASQLSSWVQSPSQA